MLITENNSKISHIERVKCYEYITETNKSKSLDYSIGQNTSKQKSSLLSTNNKLTK